jgi:hypothetical protein
MNNTTNGENKMAEFNITDPEIIKMLKGLTEEERQDVADQIQESLDSGEIKKICESLECNRTNHYCGGCGCDGCDGSKNCENKE